ncbi:MAG: alpha/beta hydrolase [Oscillospiraceae bacterium]|nr:alpha/beta hydrolase [Oscillospiraceae bacterium]
MDRKSLKTAACAAAAAAAGTLAASFGIYLFGFYSPRGQQNDDHHILVDIRSKEQYDRSIALIDRMNEKPYERVSIRSFDGLKLAGRYYHAKDGAPLAILCHGYRGTPSRDFCGGAEIFFGLGFNLLLIEERAHCTSGGHSITFGVKERQDVLSWTRYAVERFGADVKILLAGISMGAGTVLMASELDLPANVRGILADCPFTSPAEIITEFGKAQGIPMKIAYPFTALAARVFGGFSLTAADASEAVKNAKVPVLLVHGEADELVPCEMGRRIAEANPEKVEFCTFPGARHGMSYMADTARYTELVRAFCERALR